MNKLPVKMVIIPEMVDIANPGEIVLKDCYGGNLMFACPGCGHMGAIPIYAKGQKTDRGWEIESGTIKDCDLTLTPSINCVGCCGWHGFLRNGTFTHI